MLGRLNVSVIEKALANSRGLWPARPRELSFRASVAGASFGGATGVSPNLTRGKHPTRGTPPNAELLCLLAHSLAHKHPHKHFLSSPSNGTQAPLGNSPRNLHSGFKMHCFWGPHAGENVFRCLVFISPRKLPLHLAEVWV